MIAKDYLQQVRGLKVAINGKSERMAQLRSIAESTTQVVSDMPGGGGEQDKLGAIVAAIVDFAQEIAEETHSMVRAQKEVSRTINRIPNRNYRTLLELHYLNGYTWDKVADTLGYSDRQVYRMRCKALAEFERCQCMSV